MKKYIRYSLALLLLFAGIDMGILPMGRFIGAELPKKGSFWLIVAVAFCFGGLCALDLARTGAHIKGAASFHGLLTPPGNLGGRPIRAKVIVFHGWDDPMAPPNQVEALGRELTEGGADWQVHAYGGTVHGFTNPKAADPEKGILYNPVAAARAWRALDGFLEECFAQAG